VVGRYRIRRRLRRRRSCWRSRAWRPASILRSMWRTCARVARSLAPRHLLDQGRTPPPPPPPHDQRQVMQSDARVHGVGGSALEGARLVSCLWSRAAMPGNKVDPPLSTTLPHISLLWWRKTLSISASFTLELCEAERTELQGRTGRCCGTGCRPGR